MEFSKLAFQIWAIAIFLISTILTGISNMKLHRNLGITQKIAWFLARRIRETFDFAWLPGFHGLVQADKTFIGGKRKNISHEKRGGLSGRRTTGKAVVAGIKEHTTGQARAMVVNGTDSVTLQGFVRYNAESGTTVHTDEALAHQGIFHKTSPEHLNRYASEFAGRHNICFLDTVEMTLKMIAGMEDKQLWYIELIDW
ncbi:MAG: hypothetical protein TE42_03890 [Candidatus Synechococcus spongiarum SP3]|uniref:ISXO2-like transposase domain-containing protein n=1 Tax=Candidatus Synechococcus spongiarum SP3 TaxID=1604020 RepID=A0A0G2IWJ2_9SYNE|nr:MAG: hypothetical protein TE42_03890 [Candidatus Synechococcus spongiarum SP3]